VAGNHIESPTDMIAVWIFVAQVGAMLIPSFSRYLGCFRHVSRRSSSSERTPSPCTSGVVEIAKVGLIQNLYEIIFKYVHHFQFYIFSIEI
jgi:hypothetical protein